MDNFIIYLIVFVLLAVGVYCGVFKNRNKKIKTETTKKNKETQEMGNYNDMPSVKLPEEIIHQEKQDKTSQGINVNELCLDVLVNKCNIDKGVASKLIYETSKDNVKHTPSKMIMTERISP